MYDIIVLTSLVRFKIEILKESTRSVIAPYSDIRYACDACRKFNV